MTKNNLVRIGMVVGVAWALWACGDRGGHQPAAGARSAGAASEEPREGLPAEIANKPVATVGDRVITVADVSAHINQLSPFIRRRWASPEKRREFVEKLVETEVLAQEAVARGLDRSPEVQRLVKEAMVQAYIERELSKKVLPTGVTEAEIQAEYERQKSKYNRPEKRRIYHIVVADAARARRLIAAMKEAPSTADFAKAAREQSLDAASAAKGGDLGFFARPDDGDAPGDGGAAEHAALQAVVKAAWSLPKAPAIYPEPVRSPAGYHVVLLAAIKPGVHQSLQSVRRIIESQVLRRKRREAVDAYVAQLRKKAKVRVFPENLDKVTVSVDSDELVPYERAPKAPPAAQEAP